MIVEAPVTTTLGMTPGQAIGILERDLGLSMKDLQAVLDTTPGISNAGSMSGPTPRPRPGSSSRSSWAFTTTWRRSSPIGRGLAPGSLHRAGTWAASLPWTRYEPGLIAHGQG